MGKKQKMLAILSSGMLTVGALCAASDGGNDATEIRSGTLLSNVTVVDTRTGALRPGMAVAIGKGKIQRIAASNTLRAAGSAQVIDADGKYVVPGYLDMHTHAMAAVDLQPSFWPMLIANGITGIREMSGTPATVQRARQLNADSAAGRVDAPEILAIPAGIFVGQAATSDAAIQFVRGQKASGSNFIKLIAGNRDAVVAILTESKKQNLDVAGHLATAVSALESSNLGFRSIEHLGSGMGLLLDCATDETSIRAALLSGQGANPPFPPTFVLSPRNYDGAKNAPFYQRILDTYSDAKCQALAQAFVRNGTWQVPTLIRLKTQVYADDQMYRADPSLIYVDKTTRALWEQVGGQFRTTVPASSATTLRQYYEAQKRVTKMMKQNGVKMLAGSDLGGIWVIPGVSLHQEFRELAAAGLSPLEVLQMTTLNGAEYLRRESTMGTVDEGKNADLVLLDENPTADVANLSKISGVVLKGKYLPKAALEKMKADVAAVYSSQPLQHLNSVLDPDHVH
jgi:imidazolonepropionase-like amidohydrolase